MTIKFFPLFFASGGFASPPQPMSPIAVSALYFGTAVLAAGMQTLVGRVSAVLGRITTMLIVKVSGITRKHTHAHRHTESLLICHF